MLDETLKVKIQVDTSNAQQGVKGLSSGLDGVKEASSNTNSQLKDLNNSLDGVKGKSGSFDGLKKSAEVASKAIAGIATAAVAAATAIVGTTVKAAYFADDMNTLAKQTGISTDQLQKYSYAAEMVDVSVETIAKSNAKLTKNMASAAEGTGATAEAFSKLGVSVTNLDGSLRSNDDVFAETLTALGNIENETERDALAMQIFGKSAQDLNPLIEGGAEALAAYSATMDEFGLTLSQVELDTLNEVSDGIDQLKATASQAGNVFSVAFAPAITEALAVAQGALQNLVKAYRDGGFSELASQLGVELGGIVEELGAKLPEILGFATNLITSLVTALSDALPTIVDGVLNAASAILEALGTALPEMLPALIDGILQSIITIFNDLPQLIDAALALVQGLLDGILASLPVILEALPSLIESIINGLLQSITVIIDAVIKIVQAVVDALPTIIQTLIKILPDLIDKICSAIITNLPMLIDATIQLIVAIATALPTIIIEIVKVLPELISSIVEALLKNLPTLLKAGIDLFLQLVKAIPQIYSEMFQAIGELVKGILDKIKDRVADMKEAGLNLIKGMWNGIKNAKDWLVSKISGFFGGIVDSIKDFFGIKSPSKLFAELGGYMMQGLGIGIEKSKHFVTDATDLINDSLVDSFSNVAIGAVIAPSLALGTMSAPSVAAMGSYGNSNSDVPQIISQVNANSVLANNNADVINAVYSIGNQIANAVDNKDTNVYIDKTKVTRVIAKEQKNYAQMRGQSLVSFA